MAVSDQIIQVLDTLCEKFSVAIDWTSANIIPYLTTLMGKLIQWEIWTSVAWISIFVVLTLASIVAIKKLAPVLKKKIENERSYEYGWTLVSTLSIVGLCFWYLTTVLVVGTQIMDIIKCCTFPEMYVFEYIQGLIKLAA
jgi:hypothetical protein